MEDMLDVWRQFSPEEAHLDGISEHIPSFKRGRQACNFHEKSL